MRLPARATARRDAAGVAAVEAALVISLLLVPLVLGVIQWGDYFWRAQRVDTLAPAVPSGAVVGTFTCTGLKTAVADSVLAVTASLVSDPELIDVNDIAVTVVEVLPDVGVTVDVHIEAPATGGLASLIPLPGGGSLVTDFSQRLSDVRITDLTCR